MTTNKIALILVLAALAILPAIAIASPLDDPGNLVRFSSSTGNDPESLLLKNVYSAVRMGDIKTLQNYVGVTETDDLVKLYRFAIKEGQIESTKAIDKELATRNPKLFRGNDPIRETIIVEMLCEKKTENSQINSTAMIPVLLGLGARGDRIVSYRPAIQEIAISSMYGDHMSLVEWMVRVNTDYLEDVSKTIPSTEDGLRSLQKARRAAARNSEKSAAAILDSYIGKVTQALVKAGVEKNLDDPESGVASR